MIYKIKTLNTISNLRSNTLNYTSHQTLIFKQGRQSINFRLYQFLYYYTYPDDRCDDTPSNWQYCQVICTPIEVTTCVQVHSNGISDAFIPATSQRGDGSNSWRIRAGSGTLSNPVPQIEAFGVNHFEEREANNAVMQVAFDRVLSGADGSVFRIDRR